MSTQLEAMGIELISGFDADQLSLAPDLYVIGNVVKRGMPLMEAILDQGLPMSLARSGWPSMCWPGAGCWRWPAPTAKPPPVDAGVDSGRRRSGAGLSDWRHPENFGVSARLPGAPRAEPGGQSRFCHRSRRIRHGVFDKRSKFVHYRPRTAVLNNLEFDHADIFADLAAIETQFHHLVRTVPGKGRLVVNGREASLDRVLARGCWTPVERFGESGEWSCGPVDADGACDILLVGMPQGRLNWRLLGEHNRLNALAAIAAARHVGVPPAVAIDALSRFANVKRRMEVKGVAGGVTVYDDFAHHPTAIATTLAGLRAKVGAARILAVLEPRSNTMKLGTMKAELPGSLADADQVFCYGANLGWDAAEALAPLGAQAQTFDQLDALVAAVRQAARAGDHVLVMSNGGFGGVHGKLLAALAD